MKKLILFIVGIVIIGSLSELKAQSDNDGWVKIAEKTVSFKNDRDKITPYGAERNVSKIKIKCIQGTVKLKHVYVKMEDGTEKTFDSKGIGVLSKGMSSFAFDLPGKSKLTHIELEYDSAGAMLITKRAKVEILGKKRKSDKDK